jgi:ATP-dependent 26S proteasome regulatory subunit
VTKKYGIDLDPAKIDEIINRELYAFGKRVTTFNDVAKSFEFVVREAERPLREGRATVANKITYDNFIEATKTVSSYEFEDMTQTAKNSKIGIRPNETYADVGGLFGVKDQVIQEMSLILSRNITEKLKYRLPRGFLFYGWPGSGKTLLARAIAAETNVPFYYISGPSLFSKYVGNSEKNLRDIFTSAKREPNGAIVFCDEIDALGAARGQDAGQNGVQTSLLTELLTQLDGFDSSGNKIIFVGATNRRGALDPALLDRLPRQIEFTYPKTAAERKEVIAVHMRKVASIVAQDVSVDNVYNIFVKKSFSPRVIADTIELALRMRAMEILYASESQVASGEKKQEMNETFKDAINRITEISNGALDYTKVAAALDTPESWPLTLLHLKKALETITKDESYEEVLEMQRIYVSDTPTIGKAYGLAVLGERGDKGMILIVTTNMYKVKSGRGKVDVFGDAGKGPKASAELVVSYLRQFIPEIVDYDILVHIINPLEGSIEDPNKAAVSGPSIGQALGVSITSKTLKTIRNVDLPILTNVILTGKIEQAAGIAGWVGGIHPKETAAKIEIAAAEGFKRVSVPIGQKMKLEQDYPEYVTFLKSEGVEIVGAIDLLDNLAYTTGVDRDKIVSMLKQV